MQRVRSATIFRFCDKIGVFSVTNLMLCLYVKIVLILFYIYVSRVFKGHPKTHQQGRRERIGELGAELKGRRAGLTNIFKQYQTPLYRK